MNLCLIKICARVASRRAQYLLTITLVAALFLSVPLSQVQAAEGDLDLTFGTGGRVITDFAYASLIRDIAIQKDGKLIAAGIAAFDFVLARYNSDGSLDGRFGTEGKTTTEFFGSLDLINGVAIAKDGAIVVAGVSVHNSVGEIALARYVGGPIFKLCLQDDRSGTILQLDPDSGDYQFTTCAGLTIGGTGTVSYQGRILTLRHNAIDRRVLAIIDSSRVRGNASIKASSQESTFTITDRNTADNICACR